MCNMYIIIMFGFIQSADGLNCEQIMNTGGTVTVLCIDNLHGLIVAAVKNTIK